MPGVGKSTLAYEAVHVLASSASNLRRAFPDGIATFSGTGRHGMGGLLTLLHEILMTFSATPGTSSRTCCKGQATSFIANNAQMGDITGMIRLTREVLAGKRVLLLLDDLDAQFPLRLAREALLGYDQRCMEDEENEESGEGKGDERKGNYPSRVVLATSRYRPSAALVTRNFQLEPRLEEALALFTNLLGRSLEGEEQFDAERICAALGSLPLAIEAAATAVELGVPLAFLAERVAQQPLDRLLDSDNALHTTLAQALEDLEPALQQRFALLALLGVRSFGLACATTIDIPTTELTIGTERAVLPSESVTYEHYGHGTRNILAVPSVRLAASAADLAQLVRRSFVELRVQDEPVLLATAMQALSGYETRYQLHPLCYAYALERLRLMEPAIVHAAQRNIQAYALAYVERYRGDVPQLEYECGFLFAALAQAWQQKHYAQVIQLMTGLAYLMGRHDNYEESKRMLLLGIHACRHLQEQPSQAYFLSCLGGLLLSRGEYVLAQQVWHESLEIARQLGRPAYLWEPLGSLIHIVDLLGEYQTAQHFAETLLHAQQVEDSNSIAVALFIRAYHARIAEQRELANADLSACLRLLSAQHVGSSPYSRFFEMVVLTEQARVQGNFVSSCEYTEAAVALAQTFCDPYTVAILLLDQAHFASSIERLNEARPFVLRLLELAEQVGTYHLRGYGMFFLLQMPEIASQVPHLTPTRTAVARTHVSTTHAPRTPARDVPTMDAALHDPLSKREMAILQLIAVGLSNCEIAAQLVITVGTVKKHIEHIYNKLDTHNRVQAISRARAVGLFA